MFICKECLDKTDTKLDALDEMLIPRSRGKCELCEQGAVCYDMHHSRIKAKKTEDEIPEDQQQRRT